MPKIIRRSKKYKTICPTCGCKLSYRKSEIHTFSTMDEKRVNYVDILRINCPECSHCIELDKITKDRE